MTNRCKGPTCGRAVRWVLTETGRRMPLDPAPVPEGNIILIRSDRQIRARQLTGRDLPVEGQPAYMPHWSTCPDSAEFKRRQSLHTGKPKCRGCGDVMDPWLPANGYDSHINCLPPVDLDEAVATARKALPQNTKHSKRSA